VDCGDLNSSSCLASDVLSGRGYLVRVRARCVDARADGLFGYINGTCASPAFPADPPANIRTSDVGLYSFVARWEAGARPRGCVFRGWELQATSNASWVPD
ncbi:unnamed protein product, partial [Polarella glacialis]